MNLSLSSNGHVSPKEQHRSAGSLNPFPTECVKSQSARRCWTRSYIYVWRAVTRGADLPTRL